MSLPTAKQLSKKTGAQVDDDLYCRGYWAYWAGEGEPDETEASDGWRDAQMEDGEG